MTAGEATALDGDLEGLSREQLIQEAKRLRDGIRSHRDSTGHDLCWHHPDLLAKVQGPGRCRMPSPPPIEATGWVPALAGDGQPNAWFRTWGC